MERPLSVRALAFLCSRARPRWKLTGHNRAGVETLLCYSLRLCPRATAPRSSLARHFCPCAADPTSGIRPTKKRPSRKLSQHREWFLLLMTVLIFFSSSSAPGTSAPHAQGLQMSKDLAQRHCGVHSCSPSSPIGPSNRDLEVGSVPAKQRKLACICHRK